MTQTFEAYQIRLGDEIRESFPLGEFSQVIERESFNRGTRIWVRLANGLEHTFVACTSLIINR